jgi:hypothetical protein
MSDDDKNAPASQPDGPLLAAAIDKVAALLDREYESIGLSLLEVSIQSVSNRAIEPFDGNLDDAALGFDTNALFSLMRLQSADAIDYLGTRHKGPLVLPGQVLNEIWSQPEVLPEAADGVAKHVAGLKKQVESLADALAGDPLNEMLTALGELSWIEFDSVGQAQERLRVVLDIVRRRGLTPYVPRARFRAIGEARFSAKIPPGYADKNKGRNYLGDFFVWAEFLVGLAAACYSDVQHVIFVTNEKKEDWRTRPRAKPHPILVGEVRALLGLPLYLITAEEFRALVVK